MKSKTNCRFCGSVINMGSKCGCDEEREFLEKEKKRKKNLEITKNLEIATLSNKYGILKLYQVLLIIVVLLVIVSGFYSLSLISDITGEVFIVYTVLILFGIFLFTVQYKIIDFLFDLDKNKLTRNDHPHPKG